MSKRKKRGKRVAVYSGPSEKSKKEIIATAYNVMRNLLQLRETLAECGTVQECADFDKKVMTLALGCVLTPMAKR